MDSQPLAQPRGASPRAAGELRGPQGSPHASPDHGRGSAAPWGAQPTHSTQLLLSTAPVYQPRCGTEQSNPAAWGERDLPGQSQPSYGDLARACFSSGCGPRSRACRAGRFSTPLRAGSLCRQAKKAESLSSSAADTHSRSLQPPTSALPGTVIYANFDATAAVSAEETLQIFRVCQRGQRTATAEQGARQGHVTNLTSPRPPGQCEQEPRTRTTI